MMPVQLELFNDVREQVPVSGVIDVFNFPVVKLNDDGLLCDHHECCEQVQRKWYVEFERSHEEISEIKRKIKEKNSCYNKHDLYGSLAMAEQRHEFRTKLYNDAVERNYKEQRNEFMNYAEAKGIKFRNDEESGVFCDMMMLAMSNQQPYCERFCFSSPRAIAEIIIVEFMNTMESK